MKANIATLVKTIGLAILVLSLTSGEAARAQQQNEKTSSRAWTSLTGHQISAEFVAIRGENLILKDEEGVERVIQLQMLTSADQALAKKLEEQRTTGDAQTKGAAPTLLPVFIAGDAKSYHAVYSNENFIAKVTLMGFIEIQCLQDGLAVGEPIQFNYSHYYTDSKTEKNVQRRRAKFDKFPAPTLAPKLLQYEATLEDGATTGINYAFIGNTIQIWGWVVDPPGIKEPTAMRFGTIFTASHTFSPEKTLAEQKETLKPYTLVLQEKNSRIVRLPYGDVVSTPPKSFKRLTIEGPVFGKRSVSVDTQSPINTELNLMIYTTYAPYQGFSAWFKKNNPASKSDAERLIITIN